MDGLLMFYLLCIEVESSRIGEQRTPWNHGSYQMKQKLWTVKAPFPATSGLEVPLLAMMSWRSKQPAIEIRKQLQKGTISDRAKPHIGGRAIHLVDKSCLKVMIWCCKYYLSCWACEIRNFLDIAYILEVLLMWLQTMQTEYWTNWRILGMVEETT